MITPTPHRLHRVLGVAFGLAITVGTTIGAGILRRPGAIAELLREPALILAMWLFGGLYGLIGVINVAELGTMIPQAGGFFVWTNRAFGRGPGFVIGWCDFLGNCASLAYAAITLVELGAALYPPLKAYTTTLTIVIVLAFAAVQAIGVKAGARTQEWTTTLLAVTFLASGRRGVLVWWRTPSQHPFASSIQRVDRRPHPCISIDRRHL